MTSELRARILSALLLGAGVLALTCWRMESFAALCLVGAVILAREWWGLTKNRSRWWILLGLVYIGGAMASLLALYPQRGSALIFQLFVLVWGADIAAYLVGRKIGKHKIAPSISPGKSWEGLAAAMVISAALYVIAYKYLLDDCDFYMSWPFAILIGASFAIVGLLGDLFESALKRRAGVKDSGAFIPGHGGLFDRVDALLACSIYQAFLNLWLFPTLLDYGMDGGYSPLQYAC